MPPKKQEGKKVAKGVNVADKVSPENILGSSDLLT
jgi:hypothetical protein